jgi:hypothetical protein
VYVTYSCKVCTIRQLTHHQLHIRSQFLVYYEYHKIMYVYIWYLEEQESANSKLDLNLRKKLVKCYIQTIALCGAESWAHGK